MEISFVRPGRAGASAPCKAPSRSTQEVVIRNTASSPAPDTHRLHPHLRRALLAIAAALLITACGFFMDVFFHKAQRLLASDFYTFLVAGGLCYALLLHESRRRAALSRRMEIVAEVNHHIRNALTGVVFTAAVQNDPALQNVLRDATARIDWVLTTVLPDGSPDLQWPVQSPSWTPTAWQQVPESTAVHSPAGEPKDPSPVSFVAVTATTGEGERVSPPQPKRTARSEAVTNRNPSKTP